jgi:hypothetical protein
MAISLTRKRRTYPVMLSIQGSGERNIEYRTDLPNAVISAQPSGVITIEVAEDDLMNAALFPRRVNDLEHEKPAWFRDPYPDPLDQSKLPETTDAN